MRTYNETVVENAKLFKTSQKDREFYELKNTYGDYEEAKKIQAQQRDKDILLQSINTQRNNDSNPANFVRVKINSNVLTNEENKLKVIE